MENANSIEVSGPHSKVNAATKKAIKAQETFKEAFEEAFDRAVEFGWEMGAVEKQTEILDLIDALKEKLSPEEKDAHMTLDIIYNALIESDKDEGDLNGEA